MTLYRSKPSTVLAVQWTGTEESKEAVTEFVGAERAEFSVSPSSRWGLQLIAGVAGAQGWVFVPVQHWVVRSPDNDNDFWPVDPRYFADKYEAAD